MEKNFQPNALLLSNVQHAFRRFQARWYDLYYLRHYSVWSRRWYRNTSSSTFPRRWSYETFRLRPQWCL